MRDKTPAAGGCEDAFKRFEAAVTGKASEALMMATIQEALTHAGALSRFFWPKANLRQANLSGANLSEANLSKANLSKADLREVNFSGAVLSDLSSSY